MNIEKYDEELWKAIELEEIRQEENIELIASENYASPEVMKAQGSKLTNKYAEGYPRNRYYGGCNYVDLIEQLAIDRAKRLFRADYANVQPHSGSQANFAVYSALLEPGDTVLGMNLSHGGHLTHGSTSNFSGKIYNFISYGVSIDGSIDLEEIEKLAKSYRPKMIVGGFSSYSRFLDWSKMRNIADKVNAYLLVDMSHVAGLVASGIYPDPIPYAHVVTSTTHKTLSGPRGGLILAKGGTEKFYRKIDSAVFPGTQGGPLLHVIAAKAIALKEAMNPRFKSYQRKIVRNAKSMADLFLSNGFKIVSGRTENHLFLLDLTEKNITGKEAELILNDANIIVNRNCIPNDRQKPNITSGIRIGTAAITRRGFKKQDVLEVSKWICEILNDIFDKKILFNIKRKVLEICNRYPIYKKDSKYRFQNK